MVGFRPQNFGAEKASPRLAARALDMVVLAGTRLAPTPHPGAANRSGRKEFPK